MSNAIGFYGTYIMDDADIQQYAQAGFTFCMVFIVGVRANGDIEYAGTVDLVTNGQFVGPPNFVNYVNGLAAAGLQVGFSIGTSDLDHLAPLWSTVGANNFKVLLANLNFSIADLDYEPGEYGQAQQDLIVGMTQGFSGLGVGVTYCPYMMPEFWTACLSSVYQQAGTQLVKWFNLQCYAGGAFNDPGTWITAVANANAGVSNPNAFVLPGYACAGCKDAQGICPSQIQTTVQAAKSGSGIAGAWIWKSNALTENASGNSPLCPGQATYPANYVSAIANGLQSGGFADD